MRRRSDPNAFLTALENLRVVTEALDDGSVRAMIDLSSLPTPSPDSDSPDKWHFIFTLRPDGTLQVRRPPGVIPLPKRYFFHEVVEYDWYAGVPEPPKYNPPKPPAAKHLGMSFHTHDRFYDAPLLAAIRAKAYAGGILEAYGHEIERGARRLWRDLWRAIGPHLNTEIATLAARYRYPWKLYKLLIDRPDLLQLLKQAPGIAPRFRELPYGLKLKTAVVELLGFSSSSYDESDGSLRTHEYGRSAGFQAWVRSVPWSERVFPKYTYQHRAGSKDDPEWDLLMRIAILAEDENAIDPNRIRQIKNEREWLLFHTVAAGRAPKWLVQMILRNPAAAVRAMDRIRPRNPHVNEADDQRFAEAVQEIVDWAWNGKLAAEHSKYWADLLGDPSIAFPAPLDRVQGISRLCREYLRYKKREQGGKGVTFFHQDNFMLMYAPRQAIRQIIRDARFHWERGTILALISDPRLRKDPEIRPLLLEKASDTYTIESLLRDRVASELKPLWKRLAAVNPQRAITYIEANGFEAEANWEPGDLEPLFRHGGEIALRAAELLARLPRPDARDQDRDPLSAPKTGGLVQFDLFGANTSAPHRPSRRRGR